jgi:2'-5' RNA ligase
MRLFVAIAVPLEVRESLLKIVHKLKKYGEPVRWVNRDNFHFTVKFLGEVAEEKISMIGKTIEKVVFSREQFSIDIIEAGVFPNVLYPHVFWVGENNCLPFKELCYGLDVELEKLGFSREKNNATAHITLGRMKKANAKRVYLMLKDANDILSREKRSVRVRGISLMESVLGKSGACYRILNNFNMGGMHE